MLSRFQKGPRHQGKRRRCVFDNKDNRRLPLEQTIDPKEITFHLEWVQYRLKESKGRLILSSLLKPTGIPIIGKYSHQDEETPPDERRYKTHDWTRSAAKPLLMRRSRLKDGIFYGFVELSV